MRTTERDDRFKPWVPAAVFVSLIVVVAAVVLVTGDRDDDRSPAMPTTSVTDTGDGFGPPTTDVYGRRVDLPIADAGQPLPQTSPTVPESNTDWLTAPPDGTTGRGGWQLVYGVSVPFSTSDGPTRITDGMTAGYARTPRGAALAAAYIGYQVLARPADLAVYQRTILTPNEIAERDAAIAAGKLPHRQPVEVTRWAVAPDAYQIVSWSPDLCVLRIATRAHLGSTDAPPTWTAARLAVTWSSEDWKLLPSKGIRDTEKISSLVGWTSW